MLRPRSPRSLPDSLPNVPTTARAMLRKCWTRWTPRARTRRCCAAPASGASHRRSRRFALIGAGLLLAVATLIGVVNLSRRAAARGEPSIAVLPFANTSGGAEDDAFSDGLTDELIGALSNVPNLKVAARTSTFALKGKGLSASTIGDTLGVTTVL